MKQIFCSITLLGFLLLWGVSSAFAAASPRDQLSETVDAVIATLKDEQISGSQERQRLASLIGARFDFQTMARWVLGPYWNKADQAERQRFIDLFTELLKATYLDRIQEYSDEKVRYAEQAIDGERAEVRTFVVSGNKEIPITYRLTLQGEKWMVYDVIVENVSLVRNYRSTFSEIVRRDGMQDLFVKMQEKIKELEGNDSSGKG